MDPRIHRKRMPRPTSRFLRRSSQPRLDWSVVGPAERGTCGKESAPHRTSGRSNRCRLPLSALFLPLRHPVADAGLGEDVRGVRGVVSEIAHDGAHGPPVAVAALLAEVDPQSPSTYDP